MQAPSFVSKTRTAFHSTASNPMELSMVHNEWKHLKWRTPQIETKHDWQDRFKIIRTDRREVENKDKLVNTAMSIPFYDENLFILNMKNDLEVKASEAIPSVEDFAATKDHIPPSSVLKQLAIIVEAARNSKSMKDFLASSGTSSPIPGLSLSVVKSLVLREKEEKLTPEFSDNKKVLALIHSLFDTERNFLRRNISSCSEETSITSLPRDIHGAPPESLVVKLAEVIGNFKSLRKMTLFWCRVVIELRKHWSEEQYIPGIPLDENPDLKFCLLYQQLQVINCCITRKRRHVIATESLDSALNEAGPNIGECPDSRDRILESSILYARLSNGEIVIRLGADCPYGNLTMLETGEPVYSPVSQEGPLLTEDLIKETEEFVLRTGSVGAGCSQLLSDMQAFKAANPGCILEDFVRWHSPPDWSESEPSTEASESFDGTDLVFTKGQLSSRMQKEGNLWHEFWRTAKPVPAVKQAPLFDEDLAVDGILRSFEDIQPSALFEQLFVSLLGLGFAIAEPIVSGNSDFSKLFCDCKDYVVTTCQSGSWREKIDDLFKVYETVEKMLLNPEEMLKMIKQPEESTANTAEPKSRFKRLSLIFGGEDKQSRKPVWKYQVKTDGKPESPTFVRFL